MVFWYKCYNLSVYPIFLFIFCSQRLTEHIELNFPDLLLHSHRGKTWSYEELNSLVF